MVSFQIVPRKTPLTESAAPAIARQTTASGNEEEKPTNTIASAQIAAAITTAAPCRFTFEVQPLKIVVNKLPNDIAEYNQPAAFAPPQVTAIEGKNIHNVGSDEFGPSQRVLQTLNDALNTRPAGAIARRHPADRRK